MFPVLVFAFIIENKDTVKRSTAWTLMNPDCGFMLVIADGIAHMLTLEMFATIAATHRLIQTLWLVHLTNPFLNIAPTSSAGAYDIHLEAATPLAGEKPGCREP